SRTTEIVRSAYLWLPRSRGSSRSRKASPSILAPKAESESATPGHRAGHGGGPDRMLTACRSQAEPAKRVMSHQLSVEPDHLELSSPVERVLAAVVLHPGGPRGHILRARRVDVVLAVGGVALENDERVEDTHFTGV